MNTNIHTKQPLYQPLCGHVSILNDGVVKMSVETFLHICYILHLTKIINIYLHYLPRLLHLRYPPDGDLLPLVLV